MTFQCFTFYFFLLNDWIFLISISKETTER
jgi:hypothetical protein